MPFSLANTPTVELPSGIELFRIQYKSANKNSKRINRHILPSPEIIPDNTRFGLDGQNVAYYGGSELTALYETYFRREQNKSISKDILKKRNLIVFKSKSNLRLLDLRGMAADYPFLYSMRYEKTKEISQKCFDAGYDGIIYMSAQHVNHDCYCLYERGMRKLKAIEELPLIDPISDNYLYSIYEASTSSGVLIL
jgi:hypothetical protein